MCISMEPTVEFWVRGSHHDQTGDRASLTSLWNTLLATHARLQSPPYKHALRSVLDIKVCDKGDSETTETMVCNYTDFDMFQRIKCLDKILKDPRSNILYPKTPPKQTDQQTEQTTSCVHSLAHHCRWLEHEEDGWFHTHKNSLCTLLGNLSTWSVLQVIERLRDLRSLCTGMVQHSLSDIPRHLHPPADALADAVADARTACERMLNSASCIQRFVQALSDVLHAEVCMELATGNLNIKCCEENLHRCALMSHGRISQPQLYWTVGWLSFFVIGFFPSCA
jgi:hypothetical protein